MEKIPKEFQVQSLGDTANKKSLNMIRLIQYLNKTYKTVWNGSSSDHSSYGVEQGQSFCSTGRNVLRLTLYEFIRLLDIEEGKIVVEQIYSIY